jgi:hypothetical protein
MEEEQTASPLPNKVKVTIEPQALNFAQALDAILEGKKVTKEDWNNEKVYGFMEGNEVWIKLEDGKDHTWIISRGDIEGEDYFVIKD